MQIPKKHFPAVGLLGLVLIAATAGSIIYVQYIAPPSTKCGLNPVHRLVFMTAIIKEYPAIGGFHIYNAAILNQAAPVSFSVTSGANLTGVSYRNYKTTDNSTIFGNVGDNITLYIRSVNANSSLTQPGATGHGFTIDTTVNHLTGTLPNDNLAWGTWYTITFQLPKVVTSTYHCTQVCSAQHPFMNGGFVAGCGS